MAADSLNPKKGHLLTPSSMPRKRPTWMNPARFPDEPMTVQKAKEHVSDGKVLDRDKHLIRMNLLPLRRN